ncbi:MAG: hypothetical protein H6Q15_593 [Bacteroidetes bacterium]|nr:hypothetical protein [Bacteroidota bacterium]
MKKTIILIALIFVSIATMSQTKYGVRAGMSLSTYNSAQSLYQFKPGIHIGGVADIPIGSSRFSFLPGVYFADKGTKVEGFPSIEGHFFVAPDPLYLKVTHYNYQLEIPLLFTYNIPINEKLTLKPQIGAYVSYTIFGRINEKIDYVGGYLNAPTDKETSKDYFFYDGNYFGLGGNVGLSAFYNKYSFTLSCDVGDSFNKFKRVYYSEYGYYYPDICMFFSLGYNF